MEGRLKNMKLRTLFLSAALIAAAFAFSVQNATASVVATERIEKQVRHELNMLPYVNVFDYLTYSVDDNGHVILNGQVTNPVVKSDAGNVVKRIEGVETVNNRIQVLPVSLFDNGLRLRLFRSIYGTPALQRYGMGVNKSIRIIVENGHVTLKGVVANEMERTLAYTQANSVPGAFSVTNHLDIGS